MNKEFEEAFNKFKNDFLKNKKSIFTGNSEIYNTDNLNIIFKEFINNPDNDSTSKFDEKIEKQLGNAHPNVKELFAHAIWLWSVFADDMKHDSKVKGIKNFIDENKFDNTAGIVPKEGIGYTGQYHKTNKPTEIAYIINFFKEYLECQQPADEKPIEIIKKLGKAQKIGNSERKVAMYNILLHLFAPDKYEPIASYNHKEKIVNFFESVFDDLVFNSKDIDDKLKVIKDKCKKDVRFNKNGEFSFYRIAHLWRTEIILESKNMILHGAPGTGKTYSVENSIRNRLELVADQNANEQFMMVQFHPSYGYEDFVDGIKPAGVDSNGNLKFDLVNGTFKAMCIDAFKELHTVEKNNRDKKDKKEKLQAKKFYYVADEVNRAELSRVFGELLLCIEEDKRLRFENGKLVGTKVKSQNSNLWNKQHAVVVLNDVGELDDKGKNFYFGIPENLYFIGTMNDIDRSVDSFDMALRRRFFWKHFECDYDVISEKYSKLTNVESYVSNCKNLNNHIINENGFNLGSSYQLGHSYFLKPITTTNTTTKSELNKTWENNISPLLKEYLRSDYPENKIQQKLDEAKNIFLKDIG